MIEWFIALIFSYISVTYGHAAYYAEGVMEQVVYVRQHTASVWKTLPPDVPPVIGFVAVDDCVEIGSFVWLWHEDPPELAGPYWVVDCRAAHDIALAEQKGIIVEIDYNTATRWGVIGYGPSFINVAVIRWKGGTSE
jgi:hypothetical protein